MTLPDPVANETSKTIVIVGGGLSGALVAIQLLRRASSPLRVVVIEPRAEVGRGVAYSTVSSAHLLNVRAGNMSIFPEQPEDFLSYLRTIESLNLSSKDFAQRQRFGAYVSERLASAKRGAAAGVRFEHLRDRAQRIDLAGGGGALVTLEGGAVIRADAIVMALGNNPPATPFANPDGVEIISGWSAAASEGVAKDDTVLIVGSGLTAVDAVLALAKQDHRGAVHVVSRHGRWPLVHADPQPTTLAPMAVREGGSVLAILRALRAQARRYGAAGESWQIGFDQIRPHINPIWRQWTERERRRFLRHARALWEIHRHRMPPEAAAKIESLSKRGQLRTHRGRVIELRRSADGLARMTIAGASENGRVDLKVHRVIVCTGPDLDFRKAAQPVVRGLIDRKLMQLDADNLGLLVADDFALMQHDGKPSPALFALGPLIKGSLWETTATPEIRVQARDLATHLLSAIAKPVASPGAASDHGV
jgi:uncharacterized NAD(P)/FAD-binding protein YdhS